MKKYLLKALFSFAVILFALNSVKAQVITKVAYTPAKAGNYDTLIVKDDAIIESDTNTGAGATVNQITFLDRTGEYKEKTNQTTTSTTKMYVGGVVSYDDNSYVPNFNNVAVTNGGVYHLRDTASEIIISQTNKNSRGSIYNVDKVELDNTSFILPDNGTFVLGNAPMKNPYCQIEFEAFYAATQNNPTTLNLYYFAYCEKGECPYEKPYMCDGKCYDNPCNNRQGSLLASLRELPAIAKCTAGWETTSNCNSSTHTFVCSSFATPQICSKTSSSTAPYVYENSYDKYEIVTSEYKANPKRAYYVVDSSITGLSATYDGQTLSAVAKVLDYTSDSTGQHKYMPYPIVTDYVLENEILSREDCEGVNTKLYNNVNNLYCGFSAVDGLPAAKQAIYTMKNTPKCSDANPDTMNFCYKLTGFTLDQWREETLEKNLSIENLCERIFSNYTGSLPRSLQCIVNPPDADSFQAFRALKYSVSSKPFNTCSNIFNASDGYNYCKNVSEGTTNYKVAEIASDAGWDWINVDSQGYSSYKCDDVPSFIKDDTSSNGTALLDETEYVYYIPKEFTAKVLTCIYN